MIETIVRNAVIKVAAMVLPCAFISGCSVFMASRQPPYKDLRRIDKGVSRGEVIAYLGAPVFTEEDSGRKKDIFVFTQGYGRGNKASRVFFNSAADIYTLGLWELIGTPAEMIASGRDVRLEVYYDEKKYVDRVNILNDLTKKSKATPQAKK